MEIAEHLGHECSRPPAALPVTLMQIDHQLEDRFVIRGLRLDQRLPPFFERTDLGAYAGTEAGGEPRQVSDPGLVQTNRIPQAARALPDLRSGGVPVRCDRRRFEHVAQLHFAPLVGTSDRRCDGPSSKRTMRGGREHVEELARNLRFFWLARCDEPEPPTPASPGVPHVQRSETDDLIVEPDEDDPRPVAAACVVSPPEARPVPSLARRSRGRFTLESPPQRLEFLKARRVVNDLRPHLTAARDRCRGSRAHPAASSLTRCRSTIRRASTKKIVIETANSAHPNQ